MRARLDSGCAALLRALRARDGGPQVLVEADSRDWASATFAGARHRIAIRLEGSDGLARAERLAARLDAMEFHLDGHLVADIAAEEVEPVAEGAVLTLEALTLEER